jgi:predicted methyltransferase
MPLPSTPSRLPAFVLLVGCLMGGGAGMDPAACQPTAPAAAPTAEINAKFLDPSLDAEDWATKFELESREVFAARAAIVKALELEPGSRVADVGSGTGAFLRTFATAVGPTGRVYAVDISPRFVEFLRQRVQDEKLATAAVVHSAADSTTLPPGSVSHVFVCDTYHHFEQYPEMLASIREALVPGGTFVIVDFERIPGVSTEWTLNHVRADKQTVKQEVEAAGFEFDAEINVPDFKENYLLRFRRPALDASVPTPHGRIP